MSYTDPQISSKDPLRESVIKSTKELEAARAANTTDNTEKNITSLIQGGVNLLTQKKKALGDFNKSVLKEDQKLYDKVGGFTTEFEGFNEKSEKFFGDLIEEYNSIKTHLNNGTMRDASLGKKDLANLRGLVDQYGKALPKVLATADQINQAATLAGKNGMGAPGTLSVTGAPPGQLAIIKKISSGGPSGDDIDMRYEGGTIILFDNKTGAELNIREFNRAVTSKDNPYIKLVPDLSKGMTNAYDAFNKDHKGEMQNTFTSQNPNESDPDNPVATRTMSEGQEIKLKNALMGAPRYDFKNKKQTEYHDGGGFKEMISQYGESIWEDMMPDGLTKKTQWPDEMPMFGDAGYDDFYNNYYEPTLDYLATTTINKNATDVQRETQNKEKYNERYGRGKSKGGSKEYETKLDEYFSRVGLSEEDQEKIRLAKSGDEVEVTINGKLTKIRKT
tara:strand:+ start:388 stop:1728 length:1341 start_codon:yes stop_codon:yes gene_type:complete